MPKASILKEWGGDLDFDMGAYVRWRAEAQILKSLLSFFFLYIFYTYIFCDMGAYIRWRAEAQILKVSFLVPLCGRMNKALNLETCHMRRRIHVI